MAALILELYLPTSGAISRDCASLSEALSAAGAYYAGFPAGWAEIRERGSGRVVLAQADLHAACTAGRCQTAAAPGAIRLFGPRQL